MKCDALPLFHFRSVDIMLTFNAYIKRTFFSWLVIYCDYCNKKWTAGDLNPKPTD